MLEYKRSHKEEMSEYHQSWQERESSKIKAIEYRIRREFHKKHDIKSKEWTACKSYFGNKCACCGLPVEEHLHTRKGKLIQYDFCKDHFINNGANDLSNCIPLCKSCNGSKRTYCFDEFYNPDNPDFTQDRYDKIIQWITEDHKVYIRQK